MKTPQKAGRKPSPLWKWLLDDPQPPKQEISVCQHCLGSVSHHHHSHIVETHLQKCGAFKDFLAARPLLPQPSWLGSKRGRSVSVDDEKPIELPSPKTPKKGSDLFTPEQKQNLINCIAMYVFTSTTSFLGIENTHLVRGFKEIGVKLPDRHALGGRILDENYSRVKSVVEEKLQNDSWTLATDAWSNVNKEPVINYTMVNPSQSTFLSSVYTGEESHTGEYLTQETKQVMDRWGSQIVGMVTDNAQANKKSWRFLREMYPDKYFYGCVCHCLNLIVKDIFDPTPTQLVRTPFKPLIEFMKECKSLVSFLTNTGCIHATLRKLQRAQDVPQLTSPVITRWGTLLSCFENLLKSDRFIRTIVNGDRHFIDKRGLTPQQIKKRKSIHEFVNREDYITNLEKGVSILTPICGPLKMFESDTVPLSEVHREFLRLPGVIKQIDVKILSQEENKYLLNIVDERWKFIQNDCHTISYRLDPRYVGEELTDTKKNSVDELIINSFPPDQRDKVIGELDEFILTFQSEKRKPEPTSRYLCLSLK